MLGADSDILVFPPPPFPRAPQTAFLRLSVSNALALAELRIVAPAVHIDVYDGPLDLLLFLVRREGVDVRAIPVARICDAYLSVLRESDLVDVDGAGDYLVMAATLCQLKARDLLPRPPGRADDDEEEDPKERLQRRLVEYERFRLGALALDEMPRLGREVYTRPATPIAVEEQPLEASVSSFGLLRMYYDLVARRAVPLPTHDVEREPMQLADTVRDILERLDDGAEHTVGDLLAAAGSRPRKVFTFLACLEMARRGLVDIRQLVHLGAIRIRALVRADQIDPATLEETTLDER